MKGTLGPRHQGQDGVADGAEDGAVASVAPGSSDPGHPPGTSALAGRPQVALSFRSQGFSGTRSWWCFGSLLLVLEHRAGHLRLSPRDRPGQGRDPCTSPADGVWPSCDVWGRPEQHLCSQMPTLTQGVSLSLKLSQHLAQTNIPILTIPSRGSDRAFSLSTTVCMSPECHRHRFLNKIISTDGFHGPYFVCLQSEPCFWGQGGLLRGQRQLQGCSRRHKGTRSPSHSRVLGWHRQGPDLLIH